MPSLRLATAGWALLVCASLSNGQALIDIIDATETALAQLATKAATLHGTRCTGVSECTVSSACSYPACGSSFPAEANFDCSSDFGTDTRLCGSTCEGMVRSMNTTVTRYPLGVSFTDAEVQAFTCASRGMGAHFAEENARNRLPAWQYIAHESGSSRVWPGAAQERDADQCTDSDARLQPWYAAAASGPKDIVLVIDRSDAMSEAQQASGSSSATRLAAGKQAASALLDTLTSSDNVAIITFSNNAPTQLLGRANGMLPATAQTVQELKSALSSVSIDGTGTNYVGALTFAFDALDKGPSGATASCNKAILFMAAGAPSEGTATVLSHIEGRQQQLGNSSRAHLFTYTWGTSNTAAMQAMSCANEGVWARVDSTAAPLDRLKSYYHFLAQGIESSRVRWTNAFQGAGGLGQMVTAAIPIQDQTSETSRVVGVVAADITTAMLQQSGESIATVLGVLQQRGRVCTKANLTECQLQYLRSTAVGEVHVCPSPAPSLSSCTFGSSTQCAAVSGGLNALLCDSLSTTTLLRQTGDRLTTAETSCCSCGGTGKGKVGADTTDNSRGDEDDSGEESWVKPVTYVGYAVGAIVAVVIGMVIARQIIRGLKKAEEEDGAKPNYPPATLAPRRPTIPKESAPAQPSYPPYPPQLPVHVAPPTAPMSNQTQQPPSHSVTEV